MSFATELDDSCKNKFLQRDRIKTHFAYFCKELFSDASFECVFSDIKWGSANVKKEKAGYFWNFSVTLTLMILECGYKLTSIALSKCLNVLLLLS